MTYYIAETMQDALECLHQNKDKVYVLAGGTDLVVKLKEGLIPPDKIILDLGKLRQLSFIQDEGIFIKIGSLTTHSEIEKSPLINKFASILAEGSRLVGSPQIRNRGTIGGNLANASPAGDTIPPLYVLSAKVVLSSLKGRRAVDINKFFISAGKTVLKDEELIKEIIVPKIDSSEKCFFNKIGQRRALAICKGSLAFKGRCLDKTLTKVRIALGAVGPRVLRAYETEEYLEGKILNPNVIQQACKLVSEEAHPIDDLRATCTYRTKIIKNILYKNLTDILKEE